MKLTGGFPVFLVVEPPLVETAASQPEINLVKLQVRLLTPSHKLLSPGAQDVFEKKEPTSKVKLLDHPLHGSKPKQVQVCKGVALQ